jgi:hypothetical protein
MNYRNKTYLRVAYQVTPGNRARGAIVATFLQNLATMTDLLSNNKSQTLNIAVIGGSDDEPEILALSELGLQVNVHTYGIEDNDTYLDLNLEPDLQTEVITADLILCSQVCEHIWNHEMLFRNIAHLGDKCRYIWLGAPASNRPHASPHYYSAGFTHDYLSLNLEFRKINVLNSGQIGSRRLFESTLNSELWLSYFGYRFPLLAHLDEAIVHKRLQSVPRLLFRTAKFLPQLLRFSLLSGKIVSSQRYATESWVLAEGQRKHG